MQVVAQEQSAELSELRTILNDAQLVVVATHGRTGLAAMLIGSVAEQVVQQAPCPVLTVRGKATS